MIPTEPSAVLRAYANTLWQLYVACVAEGFTEAQAMTLCTGFQMAAMAMPQQ